MSLYQKIALITVLAAGVSACATDGGFSPTRTQSGAAIGAVTGAILGHQLDDDAGRYVGALVGGLAGGAAGNYLDRQQKDFEDQLQAEREANQIKISRLTDNSLKIDLSSEVSFDINSARVKPGFFTSLDKIADVFDDYPNTAVHIIGHTDSTGTDEHNQELSVNRAVSVERYLVRQGVDDLRIRADGRGESSPVASNETVDGRSLNRRVEIIVKCSRGVCKITPVV